MVLTTAYILRCSSTVNVSYSTLCWGHTPRDWRALVLWEKISHPFIEAVPPEGANKPEIENYVKQWKKKKKNQIFPYICHTKWSRVKLDKLSKTFYRKLISLSLDKLILWHSNILEILTFVNSTISKSILN